MNEESFRIYEEQRAYINSLILENEKLRQEKEIYKEALQEIEIKEDFSGYLARTALDLAVKINNN